MELRNSITFINVADLGNFTKAAEQLVEKLECLLFERINHTFKDYYRLYKQE